MDNLGDNLNAIQEIRFRCPCCEKLYRTLADAFTAEQPEFDCQGCLKTFLLSKNITSFGLYETTPKDNNFLSCPKCTHLMPINSKECPSCGIFIESYQKMVQSESPTLYELNKLWDVVLTQFNLDQSHQNFLNLCQEKMALNFAFQKYDELRKSMSYDSDCEKYLKQIELRLEQQFIAKNQQAHVLKKKSKSPMGQWIFAGIGFLGLSLLIFNRIKPTFPNLTGLVVAITLLSFGLWLFSSQKEQI